MKKSNKGKRTRASAAILAVVLLFSSQDTVLAQSHNHRLIRFGVKGVGGITDTCFLSSVVSDWFARTTVAMGAKMRGEIPTVPFMLEYGFQPFVAIRPIKVLQVGVKLDVAYSRLTGKTNSPLTNTDYELKLMRRSYVPGVTLGLVLGRLEINAGLSYAYASVDVDDGFFGYKGTWSGQNVGYEASIGYTTWFGRWVGLTLGIGYRHLVISDFKDELNRVIRLSGTQQSPSMDMSGFMINIGLAFQFIEIGS